MHFPESCFSSFFIIIDKNTLLILTLLYIYIYMILFNIINSKGLWRDSFGNLSLFIEKVLWKKMQTAAQLWDANMPVITGMVPFIHVLPLPTTMTKKHSVILRSESTSIPQKGGDIIIWLSISGINKAMCLWVHQHLRVKSGCWHATRE